YFNDISRRHPASVSRRAAIYDVAGEKGDPVADPAQHCRNIENQIAGVLLLDGFTVDPGLEQKVAVIDTAHDDRTERSKRIRPLAPPPLKVLLLAVLPVALADVVSGGHAEHRIARFVAARVAQLAADHDDHLPFGMNFGGVARNDDRIAGVLERTG